MGTNDHHELLFQGIAGEFLLDPQDVLINFDPHHDTSCGPLNSPVPFNVSISDFVGHAAESFDTWHHYIQITPTEELDAAIDENCKVTSKWKYSKRPKPPSDQIDMYQVPHSQMSQFLEKAKQEAITSGSKIVLTVDFDFFACHDPKINFDQDKLEQDMQTIFSFLVANPDLIKVVHFAESHQYLPQDTIDQVRNAIYTQIANHLQSLEATTND